MDAEPPFINPALPNVAPADGDQQVMSPSTVVATAAADRPGAGNGVSEGTKGLERGSSAVEAEVAVRMMAVSMAASPGQSPTAQETQMAQSEPGSDGRWWAHGGP